MLWQNECQMKKTFGTAQIHRALQLFDSWTESVSQTLIQKARLLGPAVTVSKLQSNLVLEKVDLVVTNAFKLFSFQFFRFWFLTYSPWNYLTEQVGRIQTSSCCKHLRQLKSLYHCQDKQWSLNTMFLPAVHSQAGSVWAWSVHSDQSSSIAFASELTDHQVSLVSALTSHSFSITVEIFLKIWASIELLLMLRP